MARAADATPEPEPTPATGGPVTRTWIYTEPDGCLIPYVRKAARAEQIRNTALAWYDADISDARP